MSNALTRINIDGLWFECPVAEEFGFLGVRLLCELGSDSEHRAKRLLLRYKTWPQQGALPVRLLHIKTSSANDDGRLVVLEKAYHCSVGPGEGTAAAPLCEMFQQDITGLVTLRGAVLRALKGGDSRRIWKLFYAAAEALDRLGTTAERGRPIPLQSPSSLAIGRDGQVLLLDVDLRMDGSLSTDSEAGRAYAAWFGEAGAKGIANSRDASLLHARALLLYFCQLLGGLNQPIAEKVLARMQGLHADVGLRGLQAWIPQNVEDWELPLDHPRVAIPVSITSRRKRVTLLRLSLWLNLGLAAALALVLLLRSKEVGQAGETAGPEVAIYSSYCVVFPAQGTIAEKVNASLQELFPGRIMEIRRATDQRDRLLQEQMVRSIHSAGNPHQLRQLLDRLASQHAIRFKGYIPGEADDGLPTVIERGGIFTQTDSSREQHGSLLQIGGLDLILDRAGLKSQQDARATLASLKGAVAEYASLKDALGIIGGRTAYLVRLEPTAVEHAEVRRKLLSRLEKPVFVSHPTPVLFDAVDPTADTGGGAAAYTLQLDRRCYWRLASRNDRQQVDTANNASNDRMKWREFPPGQIISWKPIPVTRQNGRTDAVASFDIAVVLADSKLVVFRNQNFFVGDSRQQVFTQARNYLERALGLQAQPIEDAVSVRSQGGQFTGALRYSYVAEQVTADKASTEKDLQLIDPQAFAQLRSREDAS